MLAGLSIAVLMLTANTENAAMKCRTIVLLVALALSLLVVPLAAEA